MARRKAKAAPLSHEGYLFEIERNLSSYSLSTAVPRYDTGIYSEYWHLEFQSRCLAPAKLAGRQTRLLFIARRDFFERPASAEPAWRPLGISHLTMRGAQSEMSCSIPFDAGWGLASAVNGGFFKYLETYGAVLKRGTAQMSYMAFRAEYDPRDFFEDAEGD